MAVGIISSFPRRRESRYGWIPAFAGMTCILMLTLTACGVKRPLIRPSEIEQTPQQETQTQQDAVQ